MSNQFDVIRHRILEEHNLEQLTINASRRNLPYVSTDPQGPTTAVIYKNAAKLITNASGINADYTKANIFLNLGLTTEGKIITKLVFIAKTDNGTNFSTVKISPISDSLAIYPPEGFRVVEGNQAVNSNIKQEVDNFTLSVAPGASVEYQIEWYEI